MSCKQTIRSRFDRRDFLKSSAAAVGSTLLFPVAGWTKNDSVRFAENPFSLGVASGDPRSDSVVLWTRLAPDPLNGGGMTTAKVPVSWEVALDERMQQVVAKGKVDAESQSAHSVHVEVDGLKPEQWYWYRFTVDAGSSVVGRTRTAPAARAQNERLNFAFASCQHYETGYYHAYRHLVQDDLDLVLHLGDYIYEGGVTADRVRKHNSAEIMTLDAYRNRYALYKGDQLLQEAHARFPWGVIWDDHEVENNYANLSAQDKDPVEQFRQRRAQAYQAWYEHQPVRRSLMRRGGGLQIYRQLNYGSLANFYLLDTRQYRTDQPCGDGAKAPCPETLDPQATILGAEQEKWLTRGLSNSRSRWNIIAQQVMVAQVDSAPGEEKRYPMDQWNGYALNRRRLLEFLRDRRPSNPIVLTGDIHTNWAADLKPDFDRTDSPVVGTEFVGTSISSGGDGSDHRPNTPAVLAENPHIKFFNAQRGYVRCSVNTKNWTTDYRVVSGVTTASAEISTRASFVVEDGRPGVKSA